jgi:hypothetical protein
MINIHISFKIKCINYISPYIYIYIYFQKKEEEVIYPGTTVTDFLSVQNPKIFSFNPYKTLRILGKEYGICMSI